MLEGGRRCPGPRTASTQEQDRRHLKMAYPGGHSGDVRSRFFLWGGAGRKRYDFMVDRCQCNFSRDRGHHCPGTSNHNCFLHAGSTIDVIEPDDCRRLGIGAGGSLFPQTQSQGFGKTTRGHPFDRGLLAKQSNPDSSGGRIYQYR